MRFRVLPSSTRFLQLFDYTQEEYQQVETYFKRKVEAAKFDPRVKKGYWDGMVSFFTKGFIPIGLWQKTLELKKKFGYEVDFVGLEELFNLTITSNDIQDLLNPHIHMQPREYQWIAVWNMLRWKFCTLQLATSSGKTYMIYLFFIHLFLTKKIKKLLIIVPNTSLVIQTSEEFYQYGLTKINSALKIKQIYGGQDESHEDCHIVIGTFQSLVKKDLEWFEDFSAVIVDECHSTKATSIKKILNSCVNSQYRIGLSGTTKAKGDSADNWTIQAFLGPVVMEVTPDFLMKNGYATQVMIKQFILNYLDEDTRHNLRTLKADPGSNSGSKILTLEQDIVVNHPKRFDFVIQLASKVTKNTIMLFSDVKDKFGLRIYNAIREQLHDKEVYYVDGGTGTEQRQYYIKKMEEGNNKILLASFGTFSTGISIKNVHNIVFLESYKSEVIVNQSIGRGMRLLGDKEFFTIIDIVDDYSIGRHRNYLLKHGDERRSMYSLSNYPIKIFNMDL